MMLIILCINYSDLGLGSAVSRSKALQGVTLHLLMEFPNQW